MLIVIFSIFGALVGLAAALAVHWLTWRLRFGFPILTIGLGLLGAVLSAYFAVELFSPYLGLPVIYSIVIVAVVLSIIAFLVVRQSRILGLPWWKVAAAQFVNALFLFVLVLGSVMLRDELISRFYPDYGEFAFDLIYSTQTWLAVTLIFSLPVLETMRTFGLGRVFGRKG